MANFRKRFSMISLAALAALGMTSCGKNDKPDESIPSGSVIIPSSNGGTQTSTSSNKPSGKAYDNENEYFHHKQLIKYLTHSSQLLDQMVKLLV